MGSHTSVGVSFCYVGLETYINRNQLFLFKLVGFTPTEFVGLKNYTDVLSDTNFITVLKNTYQYVLWSLVIGFPLPIICAVMVNEMVHMQKFFKISIYLPVIIPGIATCMIWRMLYMDSSTGL